MHGQYCDESETVPRVKKWVICHCGHRFEPAKRMSKPHQCSKCGSRNTRLATPEEIALIDRRRAREGLSKFIKREKALASPPAIARPPRHKKGKDTKPEVPAHEKVEEPEGVVVE